MLELLDFRKNRNHWCGNIGLDQVRDRFFKSVKSENFNDKYYSMDTWR